MSQDDFAELMEYKTQSGIGNLETRATITRARARKAAFIFRERLGRDITAEWLQDGGPIPPLFDPARNTAPTEDVYASGSRIKSHGELATDVNRSIEALVDAWLAYPVRERNRVLRELIAGAIPYRENERIHSVPAPEAPADQKKDQKPGGGAHK